MGLISEFKDFIIKGNAIDLAVGIIIGAAFGAVVTSLVTDVIMPPIGAAMGGIDFADKSITLVDVVKAGDVHPFTHLKVAADTKPVVLAYGKFINAIIALLIQGFAVFMVIKVINNLKKKPAPAPVGPPPPPPDDVVLLTEIRDLLKSK